MFVTVSGNREIPSEYHLSPMCLDSVTVDYQPEGGSLMMYTVDNATATSATLSNLQCNTQYFISVCARVGVISSCSSITVASLPARGTALQLFDMNL